MVNPDYVVVRADAARTEGRMEPRPRARLEVSDQAWEVLAQAGGNVAALHRHLKEAGGEVPSPASLHGVVCRDLLAGRVLPDRAVVRRERDEQQTRKALADLALAGPPMSGPSGQGGAAKAAAPRLSRRWQAGVRNAVCPDGVGLPAVLPPSRTREREQTAPPAVVAGEQQLPRCGPARRGRSAQRAAAVVTRPANSLQGRARRRFLLSALKWGPVPITVTVQVRAMEATRCGWR
ncbi:hypothetical protein [Streptomyces africanus]|uniref:hypothetical protein n=1 Tax=Streptomyces africanus TaxID=231024 RepID=UPI0027D7FECE|nr:hypothetical protein [Streptomyces africanus]